MESFKIENLSFTYPLRDKKALDNIDLTLPQGQFVTVCGKSGCGKTTLLRLLKSALAPCGTLEGNIYFEGKPLSEYGQDVQAAKIGFVMQNIEKQLVTDKVWHELAFGLESLGVPTGEIRARVAETASFFGIADQFHKKVSELSGGQKQILNLASVTVMQPSVLILDEPTSQLDPIAAREFLKTLEKINRETGTTVIISEHRLEEVLPLSDTVIVLEEGKIIAKGAPRDVGKILLSENNGMFEAFPVPMRVYGRVSAGDDPPLSICEGISWLSGYAGKNIDRSVIPADKPVCGSSENAVELSDVSFRYEKNSDDILRGLDLNIKRGEFYAICGGNGVGKTTALSVIAGINTPYRGKVLISGKKLSETEDLYTRVISYLPQDPQTVFVKKTLILDLYDALSESGLDPVGKGKRIESVSELCGIAGILDSHPYDLSGGEQQRAALAKVLLKSPEILILDEPTKGMDAIFKKIFADIIKTLKENSVTVIMVSHDIEFLAEYADRCALFFDGKIISEGTPRDFFSGKRFYTTAANRMARSVLPNAVLAEDIILALGGTLPPEELRSKHFYPAKKTPLPVAEEKKASPVKTAFGALFILLFAAAFIFQIINAGSLKTLGVTVLSLASLMFATAALICLLPHKEFDIAEKQVPKDKRKLTKRTLISALMILAAVPFTVFFGIYYLGDRKYYFISLLIILETMIPFLMFFEGKEPAPKELIVISSICAIAVTGRIAFYNLPQFKPIAALIIISGVCLGAETGFLSGAVSAFVSNFFFGQGPWTPWQMFSFGIIGFLSGILFKKGFIRKTKSSLCLFGLFSVLFIYGPIMNISTVILAQSEFTLPVIRAYFITGIPYDLIHAASTAFFLWFISEAMIEKLERAKLKINYNNTFGLSG